MYQPNDEEVMNAETASKSETTGLAGLPTLREQAAIVSTEDGSSLVPDVRRECDGELENQEDKGGDTEEVSNETKSHGELVVKLVRLKAYCQDHTDACIRRLPHAGSRFTAGHEAGSIDSYSDVSTRLDHLIKSESETTPKEG